MDFNFNWVDLIIVVTLLMFSLDALGRPLIIEILDFISFLLAFFLSFRYYNLPAPFFENQFKVPHGLSLVLGFILIWFLSEIVFSFLTRFIPAKFITLKFVGDKFLSIIPALARGLIFIAVILVLLATFPIQPTIKKSILDSRFGSLILKNAYQLEQPLKNVFGGVTKDTLTFLTIEPKTNQRVSLGFQTNQFSIDGEGETAMIDLVNKERASRGINTLTFDPKLREAARYHSEDMFRRGYFSHYSPEGESIVERAIKFGIDYQVIGENLAYAPSLSLAHQGLMNSAGHRANILSPDFHKIGIGVIDGGVYGKMFTQVFTN